MDTLDIVASTAEAAFATNARGSIVALNKAAGRFLGYEQKGILGNRCYEVFCGTDLFGNRFCDKNCPVVNMAHRDEGVRSFELNLRTATCEIFRTNISIIVISGKATSEFTIIHLLKPLENGKEKRSSANGFLLPGRVSDQPSFHGLNSGPLTPREIEVLRQLAAGTSTKEIATLLFISVATARNHVQSILRKLKAHSRLEAVFFARRVGRI